MSKPIETRDLLGCWRMQRWAYVYEDGRPDEHPLGEGTLGVLMYTPDGRMSTVLSRADRPRASPQSEAEKAKAYDDGFAYAGSFEVRDGVVYHTIDIAHDAALLGNVVIRYGTIVDGVLTYDGSGSDFTTGAKRVQRVVWKRVSSQ
jgi:hypothetical protein